MKPHRMTALKELAFHHRTRRQLIDDLKATGNKTDDASSRHHERIKKAEWWIAIYRTWLYS